MHHDYPFRKHDGPQWVGLSWCLGLLAQHRLLCWKVFSHRLQCWIQTKAFNRVHGLPFKTY